MELQELHSGKLELNDTQYRLWARMIVSGIHASKDTPPQVPLITGVTPKRKQSDTFKVTMVDAATAVIKAVADNSQPCYYYCISTNSANHYTESGGHWSFAWKGC